MTWRRNPSVASLWIQAASHSSDDPETLKALLAEECAENERLRQIILAVQCHRFGRRAESLPEDQLLLGLEEVEQVEAAGFAAEESVSAKKEARRVKCRTNRGALPDHLPRVEALVNIDSLACPCCSAALHRTGEDLSGRLDVLPAQFRVLRAAPSPARSSPAGFRAGSAPRSAGYRPPRAH